MRKLTSYIFILKYLFSKYKHQIKRMWCYLKICSSSVIKLNQEKGTRRENSKNRLRWMAGGLWNKISKICLASFQRLARLVNSSFFCLRNLEKKKKNSSRPLSILLLLIELASLAFGVIVDNYKILDIFFLKMFKKDEFSYYLY